MRYCIVMYEKYFLISHILPDVPESSGIVIIVVAILALLFREIMQHGGGAHWPRFKPCLYLVLTVILGRSFNFSTPWCLYW